MAETTDFETLYAAYLEHRREHRADFIAHTLECSACWEMHAAVEASR